MWLTWSGIFQGVLVRRNGYYLGPQYFSWKMKRLNECVILKSQLSVLYEIYRKIPIISPGAYFWSKGLIAKFFVGWVGGGLIHGRIFAFWKCYFFVQAIGMFLDFLLTTCLYYWFFYFCLSLIMYLQLSILPTLQLQFYKKTLDIKFSVQCSVFCFFPQSSTLCLNLVIPNITPRGHIFFWGGGGGSLYMEGVFHSESWFLNAPGLIHSGAYYQNFMVCKYTCSTINILK